MSAEKLYLECAAGISGDMLVAALLDLGADEAGLLAVLGSLPVKGFEVRVSRVKKAGLDCADFAVILDEEHENHDHDMEYLHGSHPHHDHEHHDHAHHHHEHRGLPEITGIIDSAELTENARALAKKIFGIIAAAESKAHGVRPEDVHFHEVGAVDSIADIIAVAYCADSLGIEDVIVTELTEGTGTVRCQHGVLPVPVPAVVNIAAAEGLRLRRVPVEGELVTPTGAACAAALRTSCVLPESYVIKKCGMGAGKRTYELPGVLRAFIIETDEDCGDTVCELVTDIDDASGEDLGYALRKLFEAGAKDAHFTPVFMKKNRPAYELTVLCDEADRSTMEDIIFRETTSIGIRRTEKKRTILPREILEADTPFGSVKVKKCFLPGGGEKYYPEYDSVACLAERSGMSFSEAARYALAAVKKC